VQLSAAALRQLNRLQIVTERSRSGAAAGLRRSPRRRPASEFRDHRAYTPGDDVRFIDWRASARQDRIFIKQGMQPNEAMIHLLIDASASMAWGSPPKAASALSLAAALAYMALAQGDRLLLTPLWGEPQGTLPPLGPLSGKGQLAGVLKYLRALPLRGQVDLETALGAFGRRNAGRPGKVFLISDLLACGRVGAGLAQLSATQWEPTVLHVLHAEELAPVVTGEFDLLDIETRQIKHGIITPKALVSYREHLESWRAGLEAELTAQRVDYQLLPTSWSLEGEILATLRARGWIKPL
jgi:uncharacterized protein (DUF58 family)